MGCTFIVVVNSGSQNKAMPCLYLVEWGTATRYNGVSRFITSPNNPLRFRGSSCNKAKSSNRTIIPEACCNRSRVGPSLGRILRDKEHLLKKNSVYSGYVAAEGSELWYRKSTCIPCQHSMFAFHWESCVIQEEKMAAGSSLVFSCGCVRAEA